MQVKHLVTLIGGENGLTEEIYMRYKPSEKILLDESNPGGGVRKTFA